MLTVLAKNWRLVALRGVLSIIFGIALLLFPPLVITTMVLFFGAYAFIDGLTAITTAVLHRTQPRWWLLLLEGIIGVAAGILVFMYPTFAAINAVFFVLYIVAFWSSFTGLTQIVQAIQLRKEIEGEFWLGLSGALSVLFGIFLVIAPGAGVLALITIIAAYAIVFGVMLLFLAFRLRSHSSQSDTTSSTTTQQHA